MKIKDFQKYFDLTYDQFISQNETVINEINKDVYYQKITDVTAVRVSGNQSYFFKNGRLKLIYFSESELAKKLWLEFNSSSPQPDKTVRSRAGKTSNQLVFASKGLTVSITHDEVDFMEMYTPCRLEEYLQDVYSEPSKFIR